MSSLIAWDERNISFEIKEIEMHETEDPVPVTLWYHNKDVAAEFINKIRVHSTDRIPEIDQNIAEEISLMCSEGPAAYTQVVYIFLEPSDKAVLGKVPASEHHPPGEIILLHVMEAFHPRINQMRERGLLDAWNPDFSLLGEVLEPYKIPSSFEVKALHQSVRVYERRSGKKSKRVIGFVACRMLDMLKPLRESRMHEDGVEVEFHVELEGHYIILTQKRMREFLRKKYAYCPEMFGNGLP